jgi:predicted SnoaL-like aldol condensation-catalyzing enzyme
MDDARGVMSKLVEMFATGDLDDVDSVVATNYLDHQGLGDTEIRGPDGFRRLVTAVHDRRNASVRVSIEDLIAEEDRAAARLRWLHTGADGYAVERETIDIIRCLDGQAVEHWGAEVSVRPRV